MKTIRLLIFGAFLLGGTAHAQWIVYDPTAHTQQILDQAQNIAKYVEMVNNQIEQINKLTSQLQELEKYNAAFGNPANVLNVTGADGLVRDLRKTELGRTIQQIQNVANGMDALSYSANGLYHGVGTSFKTPSGQEVRRDESIYRGHAAILRTTQNYSDVFDDVRARRRALKEEIAATTERLQSAPTASEVQKLTGVLIGLNAALAATDNEVGQALSLTFVQEAENRNDTEKQTKARGEEQKAEFSESLQNYRQTFQPLTAPSLFPENRR